jgi:hypothetical protein
VLFVARFSLSIFMTGSSMVLELIYLRSSTVRCSFPISANLNG